VSQVELGSLAQQNGIQQHDLLEKLDTYPQAVSLTIQRGGKEYRATILRANVNRLGMGLVPHSAIAPLKIVFGAGGSHIIHSYNGNSVRRILMDLADSVAVAANRIGPGHWMIIQIVPISESYLSKYNGDGDNSIFKKARVNISQGSNQVPVVMSEAQRARQQGLALTPVTIDISLGGSVFSNSFNNGFKSSLLDYKMGDSSLTCYFNNANYVGDANHENFERPLVGGPLAEVATSALRPTLIQFEVGGSGETGDLPCFDQKGAFVKSNSGVFVRVQTVPITKPPESSRPVLLLIDQGGSRFVDSFNQNGSLTILVNQFLDRLTSKTKPEVLLGIVEIQFAINGNCENSFND
jgi:hypothetical protein